jgi:hypothetical protein
MSQKLDHIGGVAFDVPWADIERIDGLSSMSLRPELSESRAKDYQENSEFLTIDAAALEREAEQHVTRVGRDDPSVELVPTFARSRRYGVF